MKFTVKILGGQERSIEVPPTTLVLDVKKELAATMNVPVDRQKLVFKGRTLIDTSQIGEYSLGEDAKVHLVVSKPLATASVPSSSPSASAATSTKAAPSPDFWPLLSDLLRRHFMPEDVDKIINEYKKDFETGLQSLNLDDLDRLAQAILEGQQVAQSSKVATAEAVTS